MAMSTLMRVALVAPTVRRMSATSVSAVVRPLAKRVAVFTRVPRGKKTARCAAAAASKHNLPVVADLVERDFTDLDVVPWASISPENDPRSPAVAFLSTSLAVLANAAYATAAFAAEGYQGIGVPDDEATPLQNAFGLLFTVFCGWYFLRVVKKTGNRAKEFRVANTLPVRVDGGRRVAHFSFIHY